MKNAIALVLVCLASLSCARVGEPAVQQAAFDVNQRLVELGIQLRDPVAPTANFVTSVRTGNLVFLSGHGPDLPQGGQVTGKLGAGQLTVEQGQEAARLTGIALLSTLRGEIGDLNRVVRVVKVNGMINADPSFTQHSLVVNGVSDLLVEVFGDRGRHARASIGMSSLPNDIAVEIDMVVEVR
jgi:enamine deaminase RidA (YjgF/YER057c/UK114 family)